MLVIAVGLASLLAPVGGPSPGPPAFVLFELIPFIVLALVARRLTWWVGLACGLAFGGLVLETGREVSQSSASTAALAYVLIPVLLVVTLPIVLAGNELVRMAVLRRQGGRIRRPSGGDVVRGVVLPLLGLAVLSWLGFLAGLGVALAVWAHRSARTSI